MAFFKDVNETIWRLSTPQRLSRSSWGLVSPKSVHQKRRGRRLRDTAFVSLSLQHTNTRTAPHRAFTFLRHEHGSRLSRRHLRTSEASGQSSLVRPRRKRFWAAAVSLAPCDLREKGLARQQEKKAGRFPSAFATDPAPVVTCPSAATISREQNVPLPWKKGSSAIPPNQISKEKNNVTGWQARDATCQRDTDNRPLLPRGILGRSSSAWRRWGGRLGQQRPQSVLSSAPSGKKRGLCP